MGVIREEFQIVDRASAPIGGIADAFGRAADAMSGLSESQTIVGGITTAMQSLSGITATITSGFSQVNTGLQTMTAIAQGASQALSAVQYSATTSVGAFNASSQGATTLGTSLRLASQSGENFRRTLDQSAEGLSSSFQRIIDLANQAGDSMEQAGRRGASGADQATAGADRLLGKLKGIVATLGGLTAIKGILGFADEMSLSATRLANVNDGLQTTEELQRLIYDSAQRSRGSYTQMMQTVSALKAQTGDTFSSVKEAVAFTELLQKQFKLAGTDATGIASTMYNLTQALSTGTLKGQDLNTIFANAPQLVQRIADYMGVSVGEIKKLASEGKVTADIVKNSLLGASEDINKQFEAMPKTFGDTMQQLKNVAVATFTPIGQMIADALNSPEGQQAIQNIARGIQMIAKIASSAFGTMARIASRASSALKPWTPLIMTVVGALGAYNAIVGISTALTTAHEVAMGIASVAQGIYTAGVTASAAGQSAFNAALAACPITWVIGAVIALITAVIALIVMFHNLAQTGHTIFGDIAGVAVGCFSVLLNGVAIVANAFITGAEMILNGWNQMIFSIQTAVLGFASGAVRAFAGVVRGAENAAQAIATAFVNGANAAIGGINKLIEALNKIPGVSIGTVGEMSAPNIGHGASDAIEGLASALDALKPEAVETVSLGRFETTSMGDAFANGFEKGSSVGDAFGDSLGGLLDGFTGGLGGLMGDGTDMGDLLNGMDGLGDAMGDASGGGNGKGGGKGNVGSVDKVKKVENCKLDDEDLKLYKDLAEQRYINNIELQTLAPQITVSVPESAAKNLTADDIANKLKVLLIEQQASHGAVSHG